MRQLLVVFVTGLPFFWSVASGQPQKLAVEARVSSIVSALSGQLQALGDRLSKPGKERVILGGTLTDSSGVASIRITSETGGKLSLETTAGQSRIVRFDGTTAEGASGGVPSETEKALLESLIDDAPETLVGRVAAGTGVYLIGRRFPHPEGGFCDLYDIPASSTFRASTQAYKRYCFDTDTGLLRYVRYAAIPGESLMIETQFEDWRIVDGQAVPHRVRRLNNKIVAFTVQASTATVGPKANDRLFGKSEAK